MKLLLKFLIIAAFLSMQSCSRDEYDDSALVGRVDNLESRVQRLEQLCQQMNTNISSLQTIVTVLQNNDYVIGVTPIVENGNTIGYVISFAKAQSIYVYHGKDGQNGSDGANGKDGVDGKDGITPELKIENDYWYISYDNGSTWTMLGKATGEDGKDGADGNDGTDGKNGQNGDSFFQSIEQDENNVYFTLADGTVITISKVSGSIISKINHIRYIPSYDDNKARMIKNDGIDDGIAILDYAISPKSILPILDEHRDMISILSNPVLARAVNFTEYPILDMVINTEQGTLSVTISGKNLDEDFFDGNLVANVILRISEGDSFIDAEPVKMYSTSYSQRVIPDNQIWYKSSNGKVIEPDSNRDFGASIISNTYVNNQGIITFDGSVSKIPLGAFVRKEALIDIVIPNTVTIIESSAFSGCNLISCNIPSNVAEIGDNAFAKNTALSISIPNNVKKIGVCAFSGCAGTAYIDTDFIVMVNNDEIAEYAKEYSFTGAAFSNVVLGSNVKNIRDNAFNKSNIRRVVIPATVKSIGAQAFLNCSQLIETTVAGNITWLGNSAFKGCAGEFNYYGDELVATTFGNTNFTSVNILGDVKSIPSNCFANCQSLTFISLPESVEELGDGAFQGCTSLMSIAIPKNVKVISNNLFDGCTSLTEIDLSRFVTIGDFAFRNCKSIKSVNFDNVQTIGANAFDGCSGMEQIEISDKVTKIGEASFRGCSSVKSVVFGRTLTTLPSSAFSGCSAIEEISIPDNIKSFESTTFEGCTSIKSLNLGNGITTIPQSAFSNLTKLENLQFSEGLTEIGSSAFYECSALNEVTLPNSIEYINSYAFSDCTSLKRFYCGANILYIGNKAFSNCNLYMFRFENNLPSAGKSVFGVIDSTSSFRIYLPKNYNDVSNTNWVAYRQWFVYYD